MRITRLMLLLYTLALSACYHDKEEALAPCGTEAVDVHYTTDITALFTTYGCYGCHTGPAPEGGISLEGYAAVKTLADDGRLLGAITHATGFTPMPYNAPQLNTCDINRVKAWLAAGAPDH